MRYFVMLKSINDTHSEFVDTIQQAREVYRSKPLKFGWVACFSAVLNEDAKLLETIDNLDEKNKIKRRYNIPLNGDDNTSTGNLPIALVYKKNNHF